MRKLFKALRGAAERRLDLMLNFYPPYLGAGVRVREMSPDYRRVVVEMPLRFYNKNYVGTQFGGSLYSMCDPFYMLMLIKNLGPDYIVWDKAASIRFRRPGRGRVRAVFELTEEQIEAVRREADTQSKTEPTFHVLVTDTSGETVAEIDKVVYVRRKQR